MSEGYDQVINIRRLKTRKVMLYPQGAQIIRDIDDLKLKTGFNYISIIGITPTADVKSIRFGSSGHYTIIDIEVELVDNPDSFDDVYPFDPSDSSDDETDVAPKETCPEVELLGTEIEKLQQESDDFQEVIDSNESSIKILEATLERLGIEDLTLISASLSVYQKQRSEFYTAIASARVAKRILDNKILALKDQKTRIEDKNQKHNLKKKTYKRNVLEEIRTADRIERAKFWPIKVYRVRLTIDSAVLGPEAHITHLPFAYIVEGVSWTPKYSLNISASGGGTLVSQAEVQNTTSETWENAQIILSTSQALVSDLQIPMLNLTPWPLCLTKPTGSIEVTPAEALYPIFSHQEKDIAITGQPKLQHDDTNDADDEIRIKTGSQRDESFLQKLRSPRTIEPSLTKKRLNISIKQIDSISVLTDIVPKLRAEAFCRARITNTTATAILEGPAVLTLNGKFMGYTRLPHCPAGESFVLSVGINPAIKVDYNVSYMPHPDFKGSKKGTKEYWATFTRHINLENTTTTSSFSNAAHILVEDQIPITQDKELNIEVWTPKGLRAGGESVPIDRGLFENAGSQLDDISEQAWGSASAQLDENGSVFWKVRLEAGKRIQLKLSYTLSHPAGEKVLGPLINNSSN